VDFVETLPLAPCDQVAEPGWDVSDELDFVHQIADPQSHSMTEPERILRSTGAGVASADLNGDGHLDLVFTSQVGGNQVFAGLGDGSFEAIGGTGLELPQGNWISIAIADFDGDGLLDVTLGGLEDLRILRANGEFQFTDLTDELGVQASSGIATALTWADFDGDLDLDLYAGWAPLVDFAQMHDPGAGTDSLWRQDTEGFTDIGASFAREGNTDGFVFDAKWRDFDDDGDLDLLLLHDFGEQHNSELWENRGPEGESWSWFDRLPDSGIGILWAPMGSVVKDLNGDGLDDLWISDKGDNRLFQQIAPWSYVDVGSAWGQNVPSEIGHVSWSVLTLDPLSSGQPGVYVGYGPLESGGDDHHFPEDQPDRFWLPPDEASAAPIFEASDHLISGTLAGNARGAVRGDINGDGLADLVISNIGQGATILQSRCTDNPRLVVELLDHASPNQRAVGARVSVRAGEQLQTETVSGGGRGTHSSSEGALFFGLGAAEEASLTVRWPDGEQTLFETDCINCRLQVIRP